MLHAMREQLFSESVNGACCQEGAGTLIYYGLSFFNFLFFFCGLLVRAAFYKHNG